MRIGSTFVIERKNEKMKFKNIFKNRDNMTTTKIQIDKEMDDEYDKMQRKQVVADELSVEPIDTRLSERKNKYYGYLQNLKIIKGELKERMELYKTTNQEFCWLCCLF
jgi:hypothetical protein